MAIGSFFLIEGLSLFFDVTQGQSMNYYKKILFDDCDIDSCWDYLDDLNYFMSFLKYSSLLSGAMIFASLWKGQNFGFALGILTISIQLFVLWNHIDNRPILTYVLAIFVLVICMKNSPREICVQKGAKKVEKLINK